MAAVFTPLAAKSANAAAVRISNCVAPSSAAAGRTRSIARSKPTGSVCRRSCQPDTCGEVYARPPIVAASRRVAVDFPFVPTTWIVSSSRSGFPRRASSSRIRSSPKPSVGHGLSELTQRVALCNVLPKLLALTLDGVRICVRHELLVSEHLLRPVDLLLQPRPLGLDVAATLAGGTDDRFEDPQRVAGERDANLATPVNPRRGLREVKRVVVASRRCRFRPRRHHESRPATRYLRPNLLGHMRHDGMEELEQP